MRIPSLSQKKALSIASVVWTIATVAASQEREQWVVRDGTPSFALPIPTGFMRQATEGAAFAAYGHPGRRSVLLVFDGGDAVEQGVRTLSTEQGGTLRASDTLVFDDRPQTFTVQKFTVLGFAGRSTQGSTTMLRWIAVLPTQDRAVGVQMVAPVEYGPEMRSAFEQMLARTRMRTRWRTPTEQHLETVSAAGFASLLASTLVYGLLWLSRWRKAKLGTGSSTENRLRALLLAVVGLSLLAHGSWWLLRPTWDVRTLGIALALFGFKQLFNAVRQFKNLPVESTITPSPADAPSV